jgi:hypothetical protein
VEPLPVEVQEARAKRETAPTVIRRARRTLREGFVVFFFIERMEWLSL